MRSDFDLEARADGALALYALERQARDDAWPCARTEDGLRTLRRRPDRVRVARRFRAPAGRVFDAWLDARAAGAWLFATAAQPIAKVEIDARIGGAFCFLERRRRSWARYAGRYLAILPPCRLAFTLALDDGPVSVVSIDIAARRNGCQLVLVQQPVPPFERQRAQGRWTGILYGLELTLDAPIPNVPARR